jgi:hypothetical protein
VSRTFSISASSKSGNLSPGTLQAKIKLCLILACWLVNPCKSLTVPGQNFFLQPLRAMDFSLSLIFTMQAAMVHDVLHSLTLKGVSLTCIQNTEDGVANVVCLASYNYSLVEQLQGKMVVLDRLST